MPGGHGHGVSYTRVAPHFSQVYRSPARRGIRVSFLGFGSLRQGSSLVAAGGKRPEVPVKIALISRTGAGRSPGIWLPGGSRRPSNGASWRGRRVGVLRRAESAARFEKLEGGLWHAYRRKWATERKEVTRCQKCRPLAGRCQILLPRFKPSSKRVPYCCLDPLRYDSPRRTSIGPGPPPQLARGDHEILSVHPYRPAHL